MSVKNKIAKPRVADEIMTGMRELQHMMDEEKAPPEMFKVKIIEVPGRKTCIGSQRIVGRKP